MMGNDAVVESYEVRLARMGRAWDRKFRMDGTIKYVCGGVDKDSALRFRVIELILVRLRVRDFKYE